MFKKKEEPQFLPEAKDFWVSLRRYNMNIVEVKNYLKTESGAPTDFDLAFTLREAKAHNCWINFIYDPIPPYSGQYTLTVKPGDTVEELKQLIPDVFPV